MINAIIHINVTIKITISIDFGKYLSTSLNRNANSIVNSYIYFISCTVGTLCSSTLHKDCFVTVAAQNKFAKSIICVCKAIPSCEMRITTATT